jgi:hypothetical protein
MALSSVALLAGCGGGTTTTTTTSNGSGSTSLSSSAPSTIAPPPVGAPGGQLLVTGSLSLSIAQNASTQNVCPPTGATVTGNLDYDVWVLQFGIPVGTTTTWPAAAGKALVAFYNRNDSTMEWSIGTGKSATAVGTVTVSADGKGGTVDVDMLPDPPKPNPSLMPIHVKGTFVCG